MPLPIQFCLSPQASPEIFDWLYNSGLAVTAWNSPGSWVGGNAPNNNVNDHIARIGQSGAINGTPTVANPTNIRGIMVPSASPALTIAGTKLVIGAYGIQKWSTTALNLNAPIVDGIGGIHQYGNGTITSNGSHTFTGPFYLHQGTFACNNFSVSGAAGGMGTSGVLYLGSGWGMSKATACTITINSTQTITWNWAINWSVASTNNSFSLTNSTATGTITWNPTINYNESTSRTLILNGTGASTQKLATNLVNPSGGTLSLTINGAATGIWELTGNSTYTGNTTLNSSGSNLVLRLAAGASLGSTAVTVDSNTAVNTLEGPSTTGGTASITGSVNLTGITNSNIRAGRFGNNTLTVGSLLFSSGVATGPRMTVDVTASTVSTIVVTGTCNFASATNKSTVWFTTGTTPAAGTYDLITAGTMTGTLPTVGQQPTGRTATLAFSGNKLQVTFV